MALAKSVATRLTRRTMRPNHRAVPADSTASAWGPIALPARHETGRRFARLTQAAIAAALWFATCVVYAGCRTDKDFLPAAATLVHRAEARSPAESDMLVRIEQGFGREVIGEILRRHSTGGPTDAETMAVLSAAYGAEGADSEARTLADRALNAVKSASPASEAHVSAIVSTVFLRLGLRDDGVALLRRAGNLYAERGDLLAGTRVAINLARASRVPDEKLQATEAALARLATWENTPRGRHVAFEIVRLAAEVFPTARLAEVEKLIIKLKRDAHESRDKNAEANAHFAHAWLHERRQQWPAALTENDMALALAARSGLAVAPDWLWQRARVLRAMSKIDEARGIYADLIARLGPLKSSIDPVLLGAGSSFRERYGDAYLEYADLLLTHSHTTASSERQRLLRQAREVAEFSKVVEISDYFRDPCIGSVAQAQSVDAADTAAVTLYPIVFADRMELLLSQGAKIDLVTVPVTRADLVKTIRDFRGLLEKRTTAQHLRPSRRLYDMLIRPIEKFLPTDAAATLVIVPDATLRSIPFSALHDGKRYLVERISLGTTVSLSLTNPRKIDTQDVRASVLGLTEARLGFTGLPAVKDETGRVAQLLRTSPQLDASFTRKRLLDEMAISNPSVVHIASHGQFSSDPRDSFLLTYDARMDIDSLRAAVSSSGTTNRSLELLMLSACQTAAGDERSAMGLAGVALRSGARSALASLWFVNDESTAELSSRFYENLIAKKLTRAAALRNAQMAMIADERFAHPAYWAPFLMIGSWL